MPLTKEIRRETSSLPVLGRELDVVICNVFGHLNAGDAMLLETLLAALRAANRKVRVSGVAFDPKVQREWLPEIVWHERPGNVARSGKVGRLQQLAWLIAMGLMATNRRFAVLRHLLPASQRAAIDAFQRADLVISCPGGYLEDSNSAYILNLLQVLIARQCAPKVVLAPQSIGPIRGRLGRWLAARAVKTSDLTFVREKESLDFVREVVGESSWAAVSKKVELVGDMAFWFDGEPEGDPEQELRRLGVDPSRPICGLTVVDWKFRNMPNPEPLKARYVEALSELLNYIRSTTNYQVVFFNQVTSDLDLGAVVAERHPEVILDRYERDSGTFSRLIGKCDIFIGTRFHSCIFSLIGAVPTIAIAYLPKTTGIMRDLELSDFVIDINTVTGPELIAKFRQVDGRRSQVSHLVAERVAEYKSAHAGFYRELTSLMTSSNEGAR